MATVLSASNHNINRMEVPQHGPNSPIPEGINLSPTTKKIAVLALVCFAAFLVVGPTFIIKTTSLIVGLGCIGLIFYTLWKNREQQPEGIRLLRSSNNTNIPSSTHTTIGGGHTPSQGAHTGVGSGHSQLPAKKATNAPMQTGTGHTQVGGGHQNTSSHTVIGSRAKK